jgi:LCP family protein required for cell wall assembly
VLSWVAVATSGSILAASVLGYLVINHYNANINRLSGVLGGLPGVAQHAAPPHGAQNYLLVGSDSRTGANGAGTQGVGAAVVVGQRSDTVILAHLYGGGSDQVQLISFPRDSYVLIPAYPDPKTGVLRPAHRDKLNAAFADGGPKLLINTITQLTGLPIGHFLQIDFTGFKGMVNALGGVDVCLSRAAKEHNSQIDLSAGYHHINGDVALSFVRQRYGLPNGDIDRIKRQQYFLASLVREVLSAGTLLNPFRLTGFLNVATSSLQVDENLSVNDLKNLAFRLRGFSAGGVLFSTVNIADIGGRVHGADVVLLDDAKNAVLFDQLRQDHAPGAPTATPANAAPPAAPLIVAPAAIRVQVYNGSGIPGRGRSAAAALAAVGFSISGVPASRGTGNTHTTISYGPAKADSARTLAAALPGSVLTPDASLGRTLQVIIGSSYTNAHPVTITGTPATPAAAASTAPKPAVSAADTTCAP